MKVAALIQARFSSARLPGKVMREILGRPMLELLLERVRFARTIHSVVIATGDHPSNIPIVDLAKRFACPFFVGSEDDVLGRFYQAARTYKADVIVRISGDCPLHDPLVIDQVVSFYLDNAERFDYVSNVDPPTFPDGLDTWVFPFGTLEKVWREARLPSEREHVCPYIWKHPKRFQRRWPSNRDRSPSRSG